MILSERYLDPIEEMVYRKQVGLLCWTIEYRGTLDVGALEQALRALFDRWPVLRSQVEKTDQGYRLKVSAGYYPQLTVVDGGRTTLLREARAISDNRHLGPIQLLLVREQSQGYFVFGTGHTIVDAPSVFAYLAEMWQFYTAVTGGREIHLSNVSKTAHLPAAPSQIFRARWGEACRAVTDRSTPAVVDNKERCVDVPAAICSGSIRMSPEATSRLINLCRVKGVTVGALLVGTMAVVLRDFYSPSGAITMRFGAGVDLRKTIRPPIGATDTTFLVTRKSITLDIPMDASAADIAGDFKKKLDEEIERRDEWLYTCRTKTQLARAFANDNSSLSDIILNNWGVIPHFARPCDLEFADFFIPNSHSTDSKSPTKPDDKSPMRPGCKLHSYTFEGSLRISWAGTGIPKTVMDSFPFRLQNNAESAS